MSDPWQLFPFPTTDGVRLTDGALITWPDVCKRCPDRPCEESARVDSIQTCPYGLDYIAVDDSRIIAGLVVTDLSVETPAHRKKKKQLRQNHVKRSVLQFAISSARDVTTDINEVLARDRTEALNEYISSASARDELRAEILPLIEESIHRTHDFLAFLKQIKSNVETIFELKFPGSDPRDAADKLPNEGAIYYAVELMLAKLDSTAFLKNPRLALVGASHIPVHRLVLKYTRIYESWARQRGIDLRLVGQSFGSAEYSSDAIGAIVQALLDNAVKYAPPGSNITIRFDESNDYIDIKFISIGPIIEHEEIERIFQPGYRGAAARSLGDSGMGIGLATASAISDLLDLHLGVHQDEEASQEFPSRYATTFGLRLRRTA